MNNDIIKQKVVTFQKVMEVCPELVYVGEKCLRQVSKNTDLKEGLEIVEKLKKVLLSYRQITGAGRGVAAPQIGINKKVFVTYVGDEFQVFINPKVVKKSRAKNFYRETCMSSTMLRADVKRSKKITLSWIDENGKNQEKEFDGFLARLLQHEYYHLEGVVNLDLAEKGTIDFLTTNPLEEKLRDE